MRFEQPKLFATTLLKDLNLLMNQKKSFDAKEEKKLQSVEIDELTYQIRHKLSALAKTKKHMILLIDEIDSFSNSAEMSQFKQLLRDILSDKPLAT